MDKKPIKLRVSLERVQDHVVRILAREPQATVSRTGYTVTVETPTRRYFFADAGTSQNTFYAFAKISKDVRAFEADQLAKGVDIRHAAPGSVQYHNVPTTGLLPGDAVCVDIKAAYPTTLRNMGAISDGTFRWCMDNLKKPERLKAVGMLAGSKYVTEYRDGKLSMQYRKDAPLRPWFFDACAYVGNVMSDLAQQIDQAFLFFWVDGVFMRPDKAEQAVRILDGYGYTATVEPVRHLRRSASGRYILFNKSGKDTYLCVPQRVEMSDADLVDQLRKLKEPRERFFDPDPDNLPSYEQTLKSLSNADLRPDTDTVRKTILSGPPMWSGSPDPDPAPF